MLFVNFCIDSIYYIGSNQFFTRDFVFVWIDRGKKRIGIADVAFCRDEIQVYMAALRVFECRLIHTFAPNYKHVFHVRVCV